MCLPQDEVGRNPGVPGIIQLLRGIRDMQGLPLLVPSLVLMIARLYLE